MNTLITISRQTYVIDMTGSELEVLTHILKKALVVESRFIDGKDRYVQSDEKLDFEASLIFQDVITKEEGERRMTEGRKKNRAILFSDLLALREAEGSDLWLAKTSEIKSQFWYDDVCTHGESKDLKFEHMSLTGATWTLNGDVVTLYEDGSTLRVKGE